MGNRNCWKSVVLVAAVAALLLAGVPARGLARQAADPPACPQAQQCLDLLAGGIALIEGGRWAAASVLLKEAAAGLEGRPSHVRDLARTYVYLGVARLQVADAGETRELFAEAQMRYPALQLDPEEFPGDVLEIWDEARDLGMLIVDSEPSGAEVSVDGVARGRSPVGVAGLRPGEHRVTLEHAGYAGVSRVLSVAAGQTERLFVPMLPASGAADTRTRAAAAPLAGIPDDVSTAGLSFGDAAAEQAPVNVLPVPARFPVGTTKKSGRSWWRTLAGILGAAGGAAMMVETARCRSGGGNLEKGRFGGFNDGILVETLGGVLGTSSPGVLRQCKLQYEWRLEFPDLDVGIRGEVRDHELVKSGAYDPLSDPHLGTYHRIDPDGFDFTLAGYIEGTTEASEKLVQDPSFSERVNQALLQSVGDAGSRYRVPKNYLIGGVALMAAGTLLATIWSDVTLVEDLAVSVPPRGGVLASRSFGW